MLRRMLLVLGFTFVSGVVADSAAALTDRTVGTSAAATSAVDIVVVGQYAYVADTLAGVRIFDVANPAAPVLSATYDTPTWADDLDRAGDRLYVADTSALLILDITNRTAPSLLGTYTWPPGSILDDVVVDGNRAYINGMSGGFPQTAKLEVLDVTDPTSPSLIKSIDVMTSETLSAARMFTDGTNLYLGAINKVESYTKDTNLALVGAYANADESLGALAFKPGYAYLGSSSASGGHVLSLATPATPTSVGRIVDPNGHHDRGAAVLGNLLFLGRNNTTGFIGVFALGNPAAPLYLDSLAAPSSCSKMIVSGLYLFLACNSNGIAVLDISNLDAAAPQISLAGDATVYLPFRKAYAEPGYTATDAVDGTLTSSVSVAGSVDRNTVGTYTVTYSVTDQAGHTATATRTVLVLPRLMRLKATNALLTVRDSANRSRRLRFFNSKYKKGLQTWQVVIRTLSDPWYLALPTSAHRTASMIVKNRNGVTQARTSLAGVSRQGLRAEMVVDPNTASALLAVRPANRGRIVRLLSITASGIRSVGDLRIRTDSSTAPIIASWLKLYDNEYALAAWVLSRPESQAVFRYNTTTRKFVKTEYDLSTLNWTRTGVTKK